MKKGGYINQQMLTNTIFKPSLLTVFTDGISSRVRSVKLAIQFYMRCRAFLTTVLICQIFIYFIFFNINSTYHSCCI